MVNVKPVDEPCPTAAAPAGSARCTTAALTYRDMATSGTRIEIISDTLVIGHIRKMTLSVVASQEARWSWQFVMMAGPPGFQQHGTADTYEETKAAAERHWQAWLKAAGAA